MQGVVGTSPTPVDLRRRRRRPADQQRGRAGAAARSDLAETVVWDPVGLRQPVRRATADGHRDLSPPKTQRLCLAHPCRCGSPQRPTDAFLIARGLNGYNVANPWNCRMCWCERTQLEHRLYSARGGTGLCAASHEWAFDMLKRWFKPLTQYASCLLH